jgi:hypothetical protein
MEGGLGDEPQGMGLLKSWKERRHQGKQFKRDGSFSSVRNSGKALGERGEQVLWSLLQITELRSLRLDHVALFRSRRNIASNWVWNGTVDA